MGSSATSPVNNAAATSPPSPPAATSPPAAIPLRRYRRSLKKLKELISDGDVPYVAIHSAKNAALPADFEVKNYPGLLLCHYIRSGSSAWLLSCWKGRDAFDASATGFLSANAIVPALADGAIADFHEVRASKWQTFPWWTVVITVSSVVGAVFALWQNSAQLLEGPHFYVELNADKPALLLAGDSQPVKFSVTNQCRFAPIQADIRGVLVPSSIKDVKFPDAVQARLSRIEPGASKDFYLHDPMPGLTDRSGGPVSYHYILHIDAKSGLWNHTSATVTSTDFTIWKPVDQSAPVSQGAFSGGCSAGGTIYSGRDQTAVASLTVASPVKISSIITVANGAFCSNFIPSVTRLVATQSCEVPGLRAFRPYDYQTVIRGDGIAPSDCPKLVDGLKIKVHEKPGGTK